MELSVPKVAMVLAGLAVIAGLGAWAYASSVLEGRLAAVRNEAREIGYARGGRLPTQAEVEAAVQASALAHEVTLEGLTAHPHDEEGLGGIGHLAPQLGATLQGRRRVYEIRATATTHRLLWTLTEPIEVDLSLRSSVSVRPGGGSSVRPRIEAPGASTDVHGGLSPEEWDVRVAE
ncbi:MAG: hypothetical protein K1X94_05280 [Sandaracinaceae bacterium]|nr:hypothetical protein [Sandaracinaceae bacterium]